MNNPQQLAPPSAIDALEIRDAWRAAWRFVSGNTLLVVLLACVGLGVAAWMSLPQMPSDGTNDALAFSAWQAEARALTGSGFSNLQAIGAFNLMQATWLRVCASTALAQVLLRAMDRVAGLFWTAGRSGRLTDETRLRVIAAPADSVGMLTRIARAARRQRLRRSGPPDGAWLGFRSSPGSDVWAVLAHGALAMALACLIANMVLGWDDPRTQVVPDTIALASNSLPIALIDVDDGGRVVYVSADGRTERLPLGVPRQAGRGLTLAATETFPVLRVSAADMDARPMTITLSSYSEPARDALLTFRPGDAERSIAIDSARMFVIFSPADGGHLSAYSLPGGRRITDTAISRSMLISDVTITAQPEYGAVIAANYHPGMPPAAVCAVLALFAGLIAWLRPAVRVIVRGSAGGWIEFYGSGRDVRAIINALCEA